MSVQQKEKIVRREVRMCDGCESIIDLKTDRIELRALPHSMVKKAPREYDFHTIECLKLWTSKQR